MLFMIILRGAERGWPPSAARRSVAVPNGEGVASGSATFFTLSKPTKPRAQTHFPVNHRRGNVKAIQERVENGVMGKFQHISALRKGLHVVE